MFTTIDGNIYLDNNSMTTLIAQYVRNYTKPQSVEQLNQIADPANTQDDAAVITASFQRRWNRPHDNDNKDLQDVYNSLPEGLLWATERELDRRLEAAQEQADQATYRRLLDAIFGEEERD